MYKKSLGNLRARLDLLTNVRYRRVPRLGFAGSAMAIVLAYVRRPPLVCKWCKQLSILDGVAVNLHTKTNGIIFYSG
jgi:hypothetical protein